MSNRGWKRNLGLVTCTSAATDVDCHLPSKGRPRGSGSISRSTQQSGTRAAARARQEKAARGLAAEEKLTEAYEDEEEMDGDPSTWGIRCQKKDAVWRSSVAINQAQFLDCLALNIKRSKEQAESLQGQLQAELNAWQPPACNKCPALGEYTSSSDGEVTYYGRTCTFSLSVTTFHCCGCSQPFSPPPLAFGCFPSTPANPSQRLVGTPALPSVPEGGP